MAQEGKNIPRWAAELGEATWERINELVDDGFPAAEIMRQAKVPGSKKRSLELYVRKHGPRRRLTRFAQFKDALLGEVESFGGKFATALTMIAEMAVSPETDPKLQVRAVGAMNDFTAQLSKMMEGDEKAEQDRLREEDGDAATIDPNEVVRRVLEHYGKHTDS